MIFCCWLQELLCCLDRDNSGTITSLSRCTYCFCTWPTFIFVVCLLPPFVVCLQELFAVYDKDKSGTISFASRLMMFLQTLTSLALVLCLRCCLQELFSAYDKDKSGTISFEELADGLRGQGYVVNESEVGRSCCLLRLQLVVLWDGALRFRDTC
jgi:hypothetical protein